MILSGGQHGHGHSHVHVSKNEKINGFEISEKTETKEVRTKITKIKNLVASLKNVKTNGWVAFMGDNLHKVCDGIAIGAGIFLHYVFSMYKLDTCIVKSC